MLESLMDGKTIKQAIDAKQLFIVDLAILEGVPTQASNLVVSAISEIMCVGRVYSKKKLFCITHHVPYCSRICLPFRIT